jgi:hypothetical protein
VVGGAIVGGAVDAYNQYKETGSVDLGQVAEAAVGGALITGGVVIAGAAVVTVGSGLMAAGGVATTVGGAVIADGDPTNEVTAITNAVSADGDPTNEVTALFPYYPPSNGFQGTPSTTTLQPGTLVDRYGSTYGKFLSPPNTPLIQRALPYGAENAPYNLYQVVEPIDDVLVGKVAPWFGKPGGGIQYYLGEWRNVQSLLDSGHLEEIIK